MDSERALFEAWEIQQQGPNVDFQSVGSQNRWIGWQGHAWANGVRLPAWDGESLASSPSQPEGWKLVPEEPTREMLEAGHQARDFAPSYLPPTCDLVVFMRYAYCAMLAASPTP